MEYSFIKENVKKIIKMLIAEDFMLLWLNDLHQRITAEEMAEAVRGYGQMTMPSSGSFEEIEVYLTDDPDEVRIDFDLWFNGKRSDLTLKCTINSSKSKKYSIDDIRIL